jgi:NHL repeat
VPHLARIGRSSVRLAGIVAVLAVIAGPAHAAPGDISTLAGTGAAGFAGDGGAAGSAALNRPIGIAWLGDGSVLVADFENHRVRRISPEGAIATVAGTGTAGFSGDGGAATSARLNHPTDVDALADGGFLIADLGNRRVRRVSAGGTISTVAGNGEEGSTGNGGPATSARLVAPAGVAATPAGGFLIADAGGHRVRAVSPGGTISTAAGGGEGGDGGPATSAALDTPAGIAVLPDGGFVVSEYEGNRVRRVSAGGTITRLAGTGTAGSSGDGGAATAARLDHPVGVAATSDGGVLIGDSVSGRVRKVMPNGTIATVAGSSQSGYSGDGGPATEARLSSPYAALESADGAVLIADGANNRLRVIEGRAPVAVIAPPDDPPALPAPVLSAPGRVLRVSGNGTLRLPVECPPTATERCRGTIRLELEIGARKRVAAAARSLVIARARYSVAPGEKEAVRFRLSRSSRRLLRKRRKLTVRAVVTRRGGPNIGERSQTVTLKLKRKPRRSRRHG